MEAESRELVGRKWPAQADSLTHQPSGATSLHGSTPEKQLTSTVTTDTAQGDHPLQVVPNVLELQNLVNRITCKIEMFLLLLANRAREGEKEGGNNVKSLSVKLTFKQRSSARSDLHSSQNKSEL